MTVTADPPARFDRRVYIVDDDDALRRMIRRIVIDAGAYTEEFDSAESFLEGCDERSPGCVIVDLQLPGMDGLELLDRINRSRPRNPVIMLSGFGDIPTAVQAMQGGALTFLQKPFRKEQLLDLVEHGFNLIRTHQGEESGKLGRLTARERNVLIAFAKGTSNKQVGHKLGLSVRTVEMHRANIIRKLEVANLTQALFLARDGGLSD